MPANRSRTFQWRRCLKQVQERQGAVEIAIAPSATDESGPDFIWRVRLISFNDHEMIVEQPTALGRCIEFVPGVELVVTFSIGQNRWTFNTTIENLVRLAQPVHSNSSSKVELRLMRLAMPQSVQRCQRRQFDRFDVNRAADSSGSLCMPVVECWPLLEPKSVVLAEKACELRWQHRQQNDSNATDAVIDFAMPEVGPKFAAALVNLGGGGVGLRIKPADNQAVTRHKLFWLRISLSPYEGEPICATCKLVHTHMESNHDVYAGMAFDFSFNPAHQHFVVEQICRYVQAQQQLQQERFAKQTAARRVA